jgi:hypothetical protein
MDARVSLAGFSMIQVILNRLETFEAEPLQWYLFRVSDTTLDLAFPIRMSDPARQRHHAVMPKHVAI